MEVWAGPRPGWRPGKWLAPLLRASLGCLPSVTCDCLAQVFKANSLESFESLCPCLLSLMCLESSCPCLLQGQMVTLMAHLCDSVYSYILTCIYRDPFHK